MSHDSVCDVDGGIAVIGMACRFPGAPDLESFQRNLFAGVHGITFFKDEPARDGYVPARGILNDIDLFDADAFSLSARDALLMDPQQRLLLETALHTFDHAGLDPDQIGAATGVFTALGGGAYSQRLWQNPAVRESAGMLQLEIGTDKDYSAPRLSYLLNLRGPSVPIQTACSSSLVAVHAACQSLINRECDTALAGGSAIPYLEPTGYPYREDDIYAPDGFCRSFDADAAGTVPGAGVGLVLLKRVEEAVEDGDRILAVIHATAVNNDGARKVGFTAPSVLGQRDVIEEALAVADLDPALIATVETHGTGTRLGDPIEIEALRQAYGDLPPASCALGAVKTNIGHAGAASGIAGLIKTVLCRQQNSLAPTLHFKKANPKLDLGESPFFVNTEPRVWPSQQPYAGVSSFGIGGTNCHVLVGPAPAPQREPSAMTRTTHLLTLSAHSAEVLAQHAGNLADTLSTDGAPSLADSAYSLTGARKSFPARAWVGAESRDEAVAALRRLQAEPTITANTSKPVNVVFCFTGQGGEGGDWGAALYREHAGFREAADEACRALAPHLGFDMAQAMFAESQDLREPNRYQPALFVYGYALACLWRSLDVTPAAVLGHSLGEYAASVIAGRLSLADAARLVATRALATQQQPAGAMLALSVTAEAATAWCSDTVSLAAINGPQFCVFAGPSADIDSLESRAKAQQLHPIRLKTTHAFHSAMMDPVRDELAALAPSINEQAPAIPFASTVTGTWLTEAAGPAYWASQVRQPVRFHDASGCAAALEGALFLEIGPGNTLTRLVQRNLDINAVATAPVEQHSARAFVDALGTLWTYGVPFSRQAWFDRVAAEKIDLPRYPFQRRRYWVEADDAGGGADRNLLETRQPPEQWYYRPVWRQVVAHSTTTTPTTEAETGDDVWLLLVDNTPFAETLQKQLSAAERTLITVQRGNTFAETAPNAFSINLEHGNGFGDLMRHLSQTNRMPTRIVHTWSLGLQDLGQPDHVAEAVSLGYTSLVLLAQALSETNASHTRLLVVTRGMTTVGGKAQSGAAWQASLEGAVSVLPLECDFLQAGCLEIGDLSADLAADPINSAFKGDWRTETTVAAHGLRWQRDITRVPAPPEPIQAREGVYLILNAFQPFGYDLCRQLQDEGATAVLVDRAFLPPRAEWADWQKEQGPHDRTSLVINQLQSLGERLFVETANPADAKALATLADNVRREHGRLDGVFLLDRPAKASLVLTKAAGDTAPVLLEKARETTALGDSLRDLELLVVFTTNADDAGGIGQSELAAAYAWRQAYVRNLPETVARRSLVIAWGLSPEDPQLNDTSGLGGQLAEKQKRFGLDSAQRLTVLQRLLASDWPECIISTRDYQAVTAQRQTFTASYFKEQATPMDAGGRPDLTTPYLAARDDVERLLVELWENAFALQPIGVQDDFFELGGHSLLAVDLLAGMGKVFSMTISLELLFANPTIATLGKVITGDGLEVEDAALTAELLDQIEGLSPEEIEAMLAEVEDV